MTKRHGFPGKTTLLLRIAAALALGAVLPVAAFAATIYVDASSAALWPDGSLAAPYRTIQGGINAAAPNDMVQVAPGVYYETLVMKNGVDVIGAGADVTVIDGSGRGARPVTFENVRFSPRLSGFTITGGSGDRVGTIGGLPIMAGGAIGIFASDPIITNNVITGNGVTEGFCRGGAIYISAVNAEPTIAGNVISNNVAFSETKPDSARGGGIYVVSKGGGAIITDNVIESNLATVGGGIYSSSITNAEITIARNSFFYNEAKAGAAVFTRDWEASVSTIVNNLMVGNGTSAGSKDCDDGEPSSNPAHAEVCADGIDNDCDPATPDIFDADGDGHFCDADCDDGDAQVHPGAAENCSDQIDNDCDGAIDVSDPDNLVPVQAGSPMVWRANLADPGLGLTWTAPAFDDSAWAAGVFGVGYETETGAEALIQTSVPAGAASVYTRTTFTVVDRLQVNAVYVGADYDDGYVVWINGVEVHRSAEMPAGAPAWNASPASHESSNGTAPDYGTLVDVSAAAIPALVDGDNALAVGVYNDLPGSSPDLVLVPRLSLSYGPDDADCLCADSDSDGYACADCDDSDATVHPGRSEVCADGIDNDCNAATPDLFDADSDGYSCVVDCDPGNAAVNPGAVEVYCDGLDNDCSALTEDVVDLDADYFDCTADCDDTDPAIRPFVPEVCKDGVDNNCDGFVDGADLDCSCWYPLDQDSDGYRCTDCNDLDPAIHPGRNETCNDGKDNDCNVSTPDVFDGDGDGFACDQECDDFDPAVHPGAPEVCNDGKDNDCDGASDGLDAADCGCADGDGDGFACADCNDADPDVNPGMPELCDDGVDNDCDAATPDLVDADSDGADCLSDCDDGDPTISPAAAERCDDGRDNDCDGAIDLARYDVELVTFGSSVSYLANLADPGLGLSWVAETFDDSAWNHGHYGVGYDLGPLEMGATGLILTFVPEGAASVYTRADFTISDPAGVNALRLGADYDDGWAAWINGVEVYRSPELPGGDPAWDADPLPHESSNGLIPDYGTLIDVSATGIPLLHEGVNTLAVGVYNEIPGSGFSTDLVVVPRLSMDFGADDPDCLCGDDDHDGYACLDCDDFNPQVNPGAVEVGCDLIDNDCDAGTPDILDADSDGHTCDVDCRDYDPSSYPGATEVHCDFADNDCSALTSDVGDDDSDLYDCLEDCDDGDPAIHPGATEVHCDGIDNDCSTLSPDIVDEDADGHLCDTDCEDTDPAIHPGAAEKCDDGVDNNCDLLIDGADAAACGCADADSDGYRCTDCNDANPAVHPGAAEICDDGVDNDCDAATPDLFDADQDGHDCLSDCDDTDPSVHPGAAEVCDDGVDNDCDPATPDVFDGDLDSYACDVDCNDGDPLVHPGAVDLCGDAIDNDCDSATPDVRDADSDGFNCVFDCDDGEAGVNPGAQESCGDGIDNDCDAVTPDVFDGDSDGVLCDLDCNDADPGRYQGNAEKCNDGVDNDCDALTDAADAADCSCGDADSDGYRCLDCNDANSLVHPGAPEVCNDGVDNDCDAGTVDLGDADSDGYLCTADCDDGDAAVHPGAEELCGDGVDNDCNGGTPDTWDGDGDTYLCDADCDDGDPLVNPARAEVGCDGIDNDCDPATSDLADIDGDGIYCADLTVRGGGVNAVAYGNGVVFVVNNTLVGNDLPLGSGGGIWIDDMMAASPGLVANNILYGNGALLGGGLDHTGFFGAIRNNAFYANAGGDLYNAAGSTAVLSGNLATDPLFASAATGNYRLGRTSPLIDAGSSAVAPLNDIDRFFRPYDGNGDSVARADIGAFEYPSGEVFNLRFTSRDRLTWDVVMFAEGQAYNLYRASLNLLKLGGRYTQNPALPIPERFCYIDPRLRPWTDSFVPSSGQAVIYLVTVTSAGFEGSLGQDSQGRLRPSDYPCP